jgi:hypothetical protein
MQTELPWQNLKDVTLTGIQFNWEEGDLRIQLRTGERGSPDAQIVATSVRYLDCPRRLPWGHSISVNEVRGPLLLARGDTSTLIIEMQSGDCISIEAAGFELSSYKGVS